MSAWGWLGVASSTTARRTGLRNPKSSSTEADLERDLPAAAKDVEALRRIRRQAGGRGPVELEAPDAPKPTFAVHRPRRGSLGAPQFEL